MSETVAKRPLAQNRWVSVLDIDLVGYTALSEEYPGAAMVELIGDYQAAATIAIEGYGGSVLNRAGDGVTSTFGHPHAIEATAKRAMLAAQQMQEAVADLSARMQRGYGFTVSARIGIDSGRVMLTGGSADDDIVGPTINRASRIQAAADPDSIFVGEATRRLLESEYVFEDRGPYELKGLREPIPLHQLIDAVAVARDPTPLVGRDDEKAAIGEMWAKRLAPIERSEPGPDVLFIGGEAGIGKSRLVEYALEIAAELGTTRAGNTSPFQTTEAFHVVGRMLSNQIAPDPTVGSELRHKGLVAELELAGFEDEATRQSVLPLLAPLVDIGKEHYRQLEMEPERLYQETINAIELWWHGLSRRGPVALLIEDIHWAEPATLDLIDHTIAGGLPSNVLLIMTVRDEAFAESPTELATKDRSRWEARREQFVGWRDHDNVFYMHLDPLDPETTLELARSVKVPNRPDDAVLEEVLRDFDGVPLYIEELVRTASSVPGFVEDFLGRRTRGELEADQAPDPLHDILLTRLESPGVDLELAQNAAAIGRRVDLTLLAAIAQRDTEGIRRGIASLADAGVIKKPAEDAHHLEFRHVFIRNEAYESMSDRDRTAAHQRIAAELVDRFGSNNALDEDSVSPAAGPIALHLERAGDPNAALWYVAAGRYAFTRGANDEAVAILDRAIDLIEPDPDDPGIAISEMTARMWRGAAWVAIEGYGSPHARDDFERSEELTPVLSGLPARAVVLFGLHAFYEITGKRPRARELIDQLREIAENDPYVGPMMDAESKASAGTHFYIVGDYLAARDLFVSAIHDFHGREERGEPRVFQDWQLPNDPMVPCYAQLGHIHWAQGNASMGREAIALGAARCDEYLDPAGNPTLRSEFSRVWLLGFQGLVEQIAGRPEEVVAATAEMMAVSDRHGFTMWSALAGAAEATAAATIDPNARSVGELAKARKRLIADLGVASYQPYYLSEEARLWDDLGDPAKALELFDQAIAEGDTTDERIHEAEIYRQRGRLKVRGGDLVDGAGDLQKAYSVASEQGTHLYRLRTAIDLMTLPDSVRPADAAKRLRAAREAIAEPDEYPETATAQRLLDDAG